MTDRRTAYYLDAGREITGYYRCINSHGNVWYEITGKLEENGGGHFVYSGNL
ncbi:hypothetical protein G5C51_03515 [Streptomyces sp. A7024]|uniref:Uncharacterized protein n=1 Tax=Streptomyces coryli TaxID=1128680 RepID=A0A6G4TT67_9ACTN|nr:hypothetical protein [Streptomyces coryli]NGN62972.1 hypothetical protein [Streptomyces coryli]